MLLRRLPAPPRAAAARAPACSARGVPPPARARRCCSSSSVRSSPSSSSGGGGGRRSSVRTAAAASGSAQPLPAPSERGGGVARALLRWLPDRQCVQLVADAWSLLYNNLVAVVLLFLAKDGAAFLLHRVGHRLLNHIAEGLFNIPISALGNPWWIMADAKFMEGHAGYQVLVGAFFLLCLPLHILLNTAAVGTAIAVCVNRQAVLSGPGVATASFTGQGRGKVGLADYPRPPSTHSSFDEGDHSGSSSSSSSVGSGDNLSAAAAAAAVAAASAAAAAPSGSASSSGGSVDGSSWTAAAGSGIGIATCRSPAAATFRGAAGTPASGGSSSGGGAAQPAASPARRASVPAAGLQPPPPPAPALPWLTVVQEQRRQPPPPGLRPSLAAILEAWRQQVAGQLGQLWRVDLLFNLWALPLQVASLAVLPAFWTFPRLLAIQLALPAALLGGARGQAALAASRQLMAGCVGRYAWPFVGLIAGTRMLELVREAVLLAMPNRWWTEVVEVPLAATALFFAGRVALQRLQDLLPLAAYLALTAQRQGAAAAGSSRDS